MQLPSEPVQRLTGTDRYLVPQTVLVRGLAYLIDAMSVAAVALVYLEMSPSFRLTASNLLVFQLVFIGAFSAYRFLWEGAVGWTPGKRLLQLTVVRTDGSRCGWGAAFLRNVLLPLDMQPVLGLLGIVSMAAGFKRQRLGDRLAGTLVVRALPLPQVPLPYVPADQDARRCGACGALQPAGRSTCDMCGGRLAQPARRREPAADRLSGAAETWRAASAAGRSRVAASRTAATRTAASRTGDSGRLAEELLAEDDATRLTAARETLMDGSRADVTLLAKLAGDWQEDDQEFVVNVARTLIGWRPRVVLTALGQHADEALAAVARDALEAVVERTAAERGPRLTPPAEQADDEGR